MADKHVGTAAVQRNTVDGTLEEASGALCVKGLLLSSGHCLWSLAAAVAVHAVDQEMADKAVGAAMIQFL